MQRRIAQERVPTIAPDRVPTSQLTNRNSLSNPLLKVQMPSVRVIGSARSFGRNHCCAQRMMRSALLAKGRAIVRLFDSLQNEAADTDGRLLGVNFFHFKQPLGVVVAELVAQLVAALGDRTHTTPFSIADIEYLVHQLLGNAIAFALYNARILILHFGAVGCFSALLARPV